MQILASKTNYEQFKLLVIVDFNNFIKTVTTWFKNQRCRLPKLLRKQLLEVNGANIKRNNALNMASQRLGQSDSNTNGIGMHPSHSLTGGISCLPTNGLQTNPNSKLVTSNGEKMLPLQFGPLYNSIPTSEATPGDAGLLESMKNSLDEERSHVIVTSFEYEFINKKSISFYPIEGQNSKNFGPDSSNSKEK